MRANPYRPGPGTVPGTLAGRGKDTHRFTQLATRLRDDNTQQGMLVTGLRGVGKTVLLARFATIAEQEACRTAFLEIDETTPFPVAASRCVNKLLEGFKPSMKVRRSLSRGVARVGEFKVKDPATGYEVAIGLTGARPERLAEHFTEQLAKLGEAARDVASAAIFLFDELHKVKPAELGSFLAGLHNAARNDLPVALVGAGLPNLPARACKSQSYAERMFVVARIDSLDPLAATQALTDPAQRLGVEYEDAAIAHVLEETKGYPYFIQEYGKHIWEELDGSVIDLASARVGSRRAREALDSGFFEMRFERASREEKRYLLDMAKQGEGPCSIVALERRAGVLPRRGRAAVRDRLVEKGLVYVLLEETVGFTVPRFAQFLRRRIA